MHTMSYFHIDITGWGREWEHIIRPPLPHLFLIRIAIGPGVKYMHNSSHTSESTGLEYWYRCHNAGDMIN